MPGVQVETLSAGLTFNGQPLAGGKIFSYDAGTMTPRPLYRDSTQFLPESNPAILDSQGRRLLYGDGAYKFVVKDANDVTLYTWDNLVFSRGSGFLEDSGSNLLPGFTDSLDLGSSTRRIRDGFFQSLRNVTQLLGLGNLRVGTTTSNQLQLQTNNTIRYVVEATTGHLAPFADNAYQLGAFNQRFSGAFIRAINGVPPALFATANGGASNAYTATVDSSVTALVAGMRLVTPINHTNSGAATMNVNGLGAVPIRVKRRGDIELGARAINFSTGGGIYSFVFDGAVWRMESDDEGEVSYTPTYSAGGLMVFTGITTLRALSRRVGGQCFVRVEVTGTTAATPDPRLYVSLPFAAAAGAQQLCAGVGDPGPLGAYGSTVGANVEIRKADGSNFGIGASRVINLSGWYEVA